MRTILLLLSLLISLPVFGALSNPSVGGTQVVPVYRGLITVNTVADLIALTPATNMVYLKAISGTNGVGGGPFELRGTNGFATNATDVFSSQAPRKFWFRAEVIASGSVSDATLVTASNAILALAPVTVPTIADMIALSPATGRVHVVSYSGTNGLGGGDFVLMHTNGFITNRGTVFASTAAKKFWFREFDGAINAEWFGAKHDGVTDDTLAVQWTLNEATNWQGNVYFPMDHYGFPYRSYRITSTIYLTNFSVSFGLRMSGEIMQTRGPTASQFIWDGAAGGTMFYFSGFNNTEIQDLSFYGASLAKYGVRLESGQGVGGVGSSGVIIRRCGFSAFVGAGSAELALSRVGGSGNQVSEVMVYDTYFSGTTGSDNGFINLTGNNTKNFSFFNCKHGDHTNDFNFSDQGSSLISFYNQIGGNSDTNIFAPTSQVKIDGWYDESSKYFVKAPPVGANHSSLLIMNAEWVGGGATNDEIISTSGALTILNSSFRNIRATNAIPRIVIERPGNSAASIFSSGNLFIGATVPPFYDRLNGVFGSETDTNNWVFHTNSSAEICATSFNDRGRTEWGPSDAMVSFTNYLKCPGWELSGIARVRGTNIYLPEINSNTNDAGAVASLRVNAGGKLSVGPLSGGGGSGDFVGPGSATDNAIVRFDGTTGKLGQNSGVTVSDGGALTASAVVASDFYAPSAADFKMGANGNFQVWVMESGTGTIYPQTDNSFSLGRGDGFRIKSVTVGTGGISNSGNYVSTALASNTFLVSAPGGIIATGIIGSGLSYDVATRTLSSSGGSGLSSFKSNNVDVLASPTILETTNGPGNVSAFSTAVGSDTVKTYWAVDSGVTQGMHSAISALQASGAPNGPIGAIQFAGLAGDFRGTNSLLWTNDTLILNNPDTTGSRYLYWSFGSLTVPAFSVQVTTNLWTMQSDTATSGPRFIQARKDDRSIAFAGNSATNNLNVYNNSNVVNAGSVENRSAVTNVGAVNNAAAVTNWNQVVGMAQFPGQPSTDSYGSTNQNGKFFTLQSALIATNQTLIWPTNGWNGLTPPFFIGISNVVGDANGTTGQVVFTASVDFATVAWVNAVSNRFDAFSVTLTNQGNANSVAASNLSYAIGTALTNYVDNSASNRVDVAITGPAFATVSSAGSGLVKTWTLTASTALGNWQGLTSHAYTNPTIVNLANNPYVAYTNITPLLTNTFWVDAGGMRTNGGSTAEGGRTTAAPSVFDSGTSNFDTFDFDDTTNECANFSVAMGPSFAGLVQVSLHWLSTNTLNPGLTNVVWEVAASVVNTNGVLSGYTYQTNLTTRFWSSNALQIATMPVMTLTGQNPRNLIKFRIGRLGTNSSDAVVGDVRLLGAGISYVSTNEMGGF